MHRDSQAGETRTSGRAKAETADIVCIWKGPAVLGECPLWDHRRKRLLWIDSYGQQIWQSNSDGSDPIVWDLPDIVGSIGLCSDDRLISGLAGGFAFIDISSPVAIVEWIDDPEPGMEDTRLNDGKVDRQGRFWCGSMNRSFVAPNASLYRLDPDLSWHRIDSGFTVCNGIAFSADGRTFYFSDSRVDRSYRYDLDPRTGALSNRRSFADASAYDGRIDGATVDAEGNYWGALFDGGAVGCFAPDGTLIRRIGLPVNCPTMCSFGGEGMDILYVTSATFLMNEEQREAEDQAGGLFAIRGLGIRGLPEPRFAVP